MERPRLAIPLETKDYVWEIVAVTLLLTTIVISLHFFPLLPEEIPIHFSGNGKADRMGSRYTILFYPLMAALLYTGLTVLQRYPHTYNYLHRITDENAFHSYQLAVKLVRMLKTTCLFLMLLAEWIVIEWTLESKIHPPFWLIGVGVGIVFLVVVWYLWKASS